MGPKGKSKKSEAPKETEEEALARRQAEQTATRAKLRRDLDVEEKMSRINRLRVMEKWRSILRTAKTEVLRKDVEIIAQNHERELDRKDAILQMLDRDLEEAEDQFQIILRSHLTNVDEILSLHKGRMRSLNKCFESEVKKFQVDFQKEKDAVSAKFSAEKTDLEAIIAAIEKEENERESEARMSFEQAREQTRTNNAEAINFLRISLDQQIDDLETRFENEHMDYLHMTSQRTHDFKELTLSDQRLTQDIDARRKRIDALQTAIQQWRVKTRHLDRESKDRIGLLKAEKKTIQNHYHQLKLRIHMYRAAQNQRLLQLSQCANSCKELLREKLELARRILSLGELSQILETEEEKVIPFASIDWALESNAVTASTAIAKATQSSAGCVQSTVWANNAATRIMPADRLLNFHRRLNKIILDTLALNKEKERLDAENSKLQDLLTQYINGTRLDDNSLRGDNPIFVVNGRSNLNNPPVRMANGNVQLTIQDARGVLGIR